ncbi:MAG: response regulator transcription factor [Pseudomonadota bacterium]
MSRMQSKRDIVLLVDDSPETLLMLTDALEAAGETVLVARDGETALQLIERIEPDLVLLDAIMPGLDGFETCRRLKQHPEMAGIPVIFMTGLSDSAHVVEGLQAGGVDYVTKPVDTDALIARIAVHVANARIVTEARSALDTAGRSVMTFTETGRMQWATPRAQELAGVYVQPPSPGADLVAAWCRRIAGQPVSAVRPLDMPEAPGAPGAPNGLSLVFLGRTASGALLVRVSPRQREAPGEELAKRLGLTQREGEVLGWLADGKANRDIAAILGVSPRTVNKHLEQIYAKLQVENRTAAVAVALRSLEA